MSGHILIPDLGSWGAEENGHEEEYDVEDTIDGHKEDGHPPEHTPLDGEKDPQDKQQEGKLGEE